MSQPRSRHQDDNGEESVGEPPNKQIKLDPQPLMEDTASKVNIDDLPDEAIVMILSFFSFTELIEVGQKVCTQWRRASHDPLLWFNKEYCIDEGTSDAEVLTTLPRVPQLRSLVMMRPVKVEVLHALCDNCTRLNNLEFAFMQETPYSVLNKLITNCRNIQSLTIPDTILVDENKAIIVAKMEQLQSLEVTESFVDDKCIHLLPLANGCPQLSKLRLIYHIHVSPDDLNQFIQVKGKSLTHLVLPWITYNQRGIIPTLTSCTSLIELELYNDLNCFSEMLQACTELSHLSNLHTLSLSCFDNMYVADAIDNYSGVFPHVKVLKISGVYMQNSILEAICEACPHIKELQLDQCRGLYDGDLEELYRLSMLETLSLISCDHLHGAALLHVSQLPNLRNLSLEKCDLKKVVNGLPFVLQIHTLEKLSFAFSRNADCFHFDLIPEMLTNLRVLNVEGCKLDRSILEPLKNQMPGLEIYARDPVYRKSKMSEPRSRRKDDEGGESFGEPPNKQIKLDLQPVIEDKLSKVNISDLPDEAITMILSFFTLTELTEVAQNVCTQWRRASHDPLLWRNKVYCVDEDKSDAHVLTTLPRLPQLRNLAMKRPVSNAVLHALCNTCTRLNNLEVAKRQQIDNSMLNKLVMNCRNIQALTIPDLLLVDENKANILSKLELLQTLEVMENIGNDKCIHLRPFATGCPQLSKLKVLYMTCLCIEDLKIFIEAKCKSLTHLVLPWIGYKKRRVVPLLKDCTSLIDLQLYDDSNNIGEMLEDCTVLSHLSNLRSLHLDFWDNMAVADASAYNFGVLSHVQVLKISGLYLQNSVLVAICECCPHVNELHLSACGGIDDGNLRELHRLRNLETLALKTCRQLYGGAIFHVSQLPKLRKLLLEDCNLKKLNDGLNFILQINNLEILSFAFSRHEFSFSFDCIPEMLTNLRVLNVEGCVVDKSILQHLRNQMPGLRVYAPDPADRKSSSEIERLMRL